MADAAGKPVQSARNRRQARRRRRAEVPQGSVAVQPALREERQADRRADAQGRQHQRSRDSRSTWWARASRRRSTTSRPKWPPRWPPPSRARKAAARAVASAWRTARSAVERYTQPRSKGARNMPDSPPSPQAYLAEAVGRGVDGGRRLRHQPRHHRAHGRGGGRGGAHGRGGGHRHRRRQYLPRRRRRFRGHGPRHGRLHGHAGHRDERTGAGRRHEQAGADRRA